MSNRFLPYDTIIEAHEGDPKVLWRKFWNITCPQNSWKKSASA